MLTCTTQRDNFCPARLTTFRARLTADSHPQPYRSCPDVPCRAMAADLLKLGYAHDAGRQDRSDFQFATHSLNDLAKRADIHIRPPLNLGDERLLDLQRFNERFLGKFESLTQFV
jgi:hypothetical protein